MNALCSTEALSTGGGRDGHVTVSDGALDLDMAVPTAMGGSGKGANPEQLFAAGYAACFHSALQGVARREKVTITGSTVGARVSVGPNDQGGFELAVLLEVTIPDVPADQAEALADAAHQVCPYSNATRGNITVTITVSDD
ncbi:MAG TPA: organic hydroperoxide resistance protein [Pseudonocardiaceae bacterium]